MGVASFPDCERESMNAKHRLLGCVVGGAIGDAMGSPYEGSAAPIILRPAKWRFSDDTQLTLATCEAIAEKAAVSPESIAAKFTQWFQQGRISGAGSSTLKALRDLSAGAHWALSGRSGEHASGNGAAMRAAPLAFFLDSNEPEDRRTLRDICRITHKNDEAFAGALAVVTAIRAVCSDEWSWTESLLKAPQRLSRTAVFAIDVSNWHPFQRTSISLKLASDLVVRAMSSNRFHLFFLLLNGFATMASDRCSSKLFVPAGTLTQMLRSRVRSPGHGLASTVFRLNSLGSCRIPIPSFKL